MTPEQCRAARAGLGIEVRKLAEQADVSTNTVSRFERGDGLRPRTIRAMQAVLEEAGATFLDDDGTAGPGVRLRPTSTTPTTSEDAP